MNEFKATTTVKAGEERVRTVVDKVTREMFIRYSGASGDFNPIHWDRDFAKNAGYKDVFGMGMWSAGVLAGFVSAWLGRESVRIFRCRFVNQVWADEQLICHGHVIRTYEAESIPRAPYRWADIEIAMNSQDGSTKVLAWATCAVT